MALFPSIHWCALLIAAGLQAGAASGEDEGTLRLVHVRTLPASGSSAEIVSMREEDRLLLVTLRAGAVDLFDLTDPDSPRLTRTVDLGLKEGEELTSGALHPRHDYFLAVIRAAGPLAPGRVVFHDLSTGTRLHELPVGVGPDCVVIDPTGRFALIADEAEGFAAPYDPGILRSAPGSLTLLRLGPEAAEVEAVEIPLPAVDGLPGAVRPEDGRELERAVGGEEHMIPLAGGSPELVEPEVVAFSPDGRTAYVTLQENNAVAVVDPATPAVVAVHGLGWTAHLADVTEDGQYLPIEPLLALREPDGIAVTPDGRFFVTADEGDTDPKASLTPRDRPAGGGRTVSVFDAATGRLVADTGKEIDDAAHDAGAYRDDRSDSKGSEPEMIVVFEAAGRTLAAVTLERADAVALVDLSRPRSPRVIACAAIGPPGPHAPEGLVHFRDPVSGRHYLYTANEMSGTITVFRIET